MGQLSITVRITHFSSFGDYGNLVVEKQVEAAGDHVKFIYSSVTLKLIFMPFNERMNGTSFFLLIWAIFCTIVGKIDK